MTSINTRDLAFPRTAGRQHYKGPPHLSGRPGPPRTHQRHHRGQRLRQDHRPQTAGRHPRRQNHLLGTLHPPQPQAFQPSPSAPTTPTRPSATPPTNDIPLDKRQEVQRDLNIMLQPGRSNHLEEALTILADEPSFRNAGVNPLNTVYTSAVQWATGHKLVCSTIFKLAQKAKKGSLALLDQPELHLHPSLQAALMKAIQALLHSTCSYAIITTNSPAILQEIPSWQVQILRRHGSITKAEYPIVETYGEKPGHHHETRPWTQHRTAGLHGSDQKLASTLPADTIENMFHQGLSSHARALVMQMQHNQRHDK